MKAIIVDEQTNRMSVGEWEDPKVGTNELLIDIKATAINRADVLQKYGKYPVPPGVTPIMGLEMSGIVEEVGSSVRGWNKGDRVCALLPGGGYAEKVTIPADMAIKIPEGFSFEEAAAIPEVFLTAYLNLFDLGQLEKNQTVLIHAGASGVGTAAIQLAREVGATIIVTAGSEEKLSLCKELGAHYTINYKKDNFAEKVSDITEGKGVDLILDFIGASYFEKNIESLKIEGRLILIGTLGGSRLEIDLMSLMIKRIKVFGSTLRSQTPAQKESLTKKFVEFAMPLLTNKRISPVIDCVFQLHEVNEAHEKMERNENKGKIILKIN